MMAGIYVPIGHPGSRDSLLANSNEWRPGYSAWALAQAWQDAQGFPPLVAQMLEGSGSPWLAELEMLLGIPEYLVPMKGHARSAQTDLFVLARSRSGLCVLAVEGKVVEPFGPSVSTWLQDASPGKEQRLRMLCEHLELDDAQKIGEIRYQLLHRTVAAMLEAQRYHAKHAVMLVHSFSVNGEGFEDYKAFLAMLDLESEPGILQEVGERNGVQLWVGWLEDRTGMRPLPEVHGLVEAVEKVIQCNQEDGYQSNWFRALTGRWQAPELRQICERIIADEGVEGNPITSALREFPLLLTIEDFIVRHGPEWGFSGPTVALAKTRANLYDKVSGRFRWR